MSSSVFYKFKNSKEPERIVFDGTGITVFELKREIIKATGLGNGSDFNFHLYHEDSPTTEYEDDTEYISRTSTVIAQRRPAPRGHGRAARYVSGRAPVRAIKKADAPAPSSKDASLSEQDAEAAFLAESAQVWDQQQEELKHATRIFTKKKPVNVPSHDPPAGYVCYRCQQKGHWIQQCPTNMDPDFKPAVRAKRTTGIPRSFLKTVEKPAEGDEEAARNVMLNADGEYVRVMTDTKTWEKFQEKVNATKAQAASINAKNKEMEARGLICPIDEQLFVDPVKTPCCGKTYCRDCIDIALADGDLVCPNCATDNVLIDDLAPDEDMVGKIRAYEAEKAKEKSDKEQQAKEQQAKEQQEKEQQEKEQQAKEEAKATAKQPSPQNNETQVSVPPSNDSPHTVAAAPISASTPGSDSDTSTVSKKRKEAPTDIKAPTAPKAMRIQKEQQQRQAQDQSSAIEQEFIQSMEALKHMPPANMPMAPNMPMGMAPNMPMNPMMNGYNQGWNPGYGQYNGQWPMGYGGQGGMGPGFQGYGNMGYQNQMGQFPNQQQPAQNQQGAYDRQPLNPHRQNRNRRQRAPDYHYV